MKKIIACLSIVSALALAVVAQTPAPNAPPKILRIFREDVKQGMRAAHAKVEAGWPRAFGKAKIPSHYIAVTSVSGGNEAWFFEGHDSWASIEKTEKEIEKNSALQAELNQLSQQDAAVVSGSRTLIATYNEALSRLGPHPIAHMRYFSITTYRVRPGHGPDFVEFRTMLKSAHEKANTGNYFVVFQVVSGTQSGVYLVFRPIKSLQELDPDPARPTVQFSSDDQKKLNELVASALINSETALYAFDAGMSYMPAEFIALDPTFWAPKPKVAAKPAVIKKALVKTGTQ